MNNDFGNPSTSYICMHQRSLPLSDSWHSGNTNTPGILRNQEIWYQHIPTYTKNIEEEEEKEEEEEEEEEHANIKPLASQTNIARSFEVHRMAFILRSWDRYIHLNTYVRKHLDRKFFGINSFSSSLHHFENNRSRFNLATISFDHLTHLLPRDPIF